MDYRRTRLAYGGNTTSARSSVICPSAINQDRQPMLKEGVPRCQQLN